MASHYDTVVPAGAVNGTATAVMSSTDILAGPPNRRNITSGLQLSYDGGGTWHADVSSDYVTDPGNAVKGGTTANPPSITTTIPSNPMPSHIRPFASLGGPTSIGLTISFADSTGAAL